MATTAQQHGRLLNFYVYPSVLKYPGAYIHPGLIKYVYTSSGKGMRYVQV
jgi:hypothetical protein